MDKRYMHHHIYVSVGMLRDEYVKPYGNRMENYIGRLRNRYGTSMSVEYKMCDNKRCEYTTGITERKNNNDT